VRRIVRNHTILLDLLRDEFTQHRLLFVYVQTAAETVNKQTRFRIAQIVFGRQGRRRRQRRRQIIALDVVHNIHRNRTSCCRTRFIEMEDFRDFVSGARAPVFPTGQIDGSCFDAVAVHSAEHLLFGDVFVDGHGVVNEDFRNTGILRHGSYELEFVVERFFAVRHGLPFGPFADLFHIIRGSASAEDFAAIRGFDQQGIDGIAATRGVGRVLVVGAVETPFGRIIERVSVDCPTGLVDACGEPVFHDHENGAAFFTDAFVVFRINNDRFRILWFCIREFRILVFMLAFVFSSFVIGVMIDFDVLVEDFP